jgi:hypothetical protein
MDWSSCLKNCYILEEKERKGAGESLIEDLRDQDE